jgi:L-ascorbate metabolism protein UlaG (beta-lactamase superfamily)
MKRLACFAFYLIIGAVASAQNPPAFTNIQRLTNREMLLRVSAPTGLLRIEVSTNLPSWHPLLTLSSTGLNQHADGAAPYLGSRYYRAQQLTGTNFLTGDHLITTNGDVVIHPITHASFLMTWNGLVIYNDPDAPTSPTILYAGLPKADLILVSHEHGDHFDIAAIDAVRKTNTIIIATAQIFSTMSTTHRALTGVLTNGGSTNVLGLHIQAVPAYNPTPNPNHPLGRGNGYVVTIGGRRIYMAGDTGDIPEMRALQNIDVAFLPMNVPFTMNVSQAVSAVRQFRPKVIYPYHFRNQDQTFADLNLFKRQVSNDVGVEVRIRKWY